MKMINIGQGRKIPAFPLIVSAGYVAIISEPDFFKDSHGFDRPHKRHRNRFAYIVGVGEEDGIAKMDSHITIGRRIVMPRVGKQEFEIEGHTFLLVHHKEVKVFDPTDNPELLLDLIKATLATVPDNIVKLFIEEQKGK